MQLVFECCAATIRPVVEAVQIVLGDSVYTLLAGIRGNYVSMDGGIESAISKMDGLEIDSFVVYPKCESIRYAMVSSPTVGAEALSLYMGTIEYTAKDYRWIWDRLMIVSNMKVVCLGFDEGVELSDDQLEVDTFPWDAWPLVVGAMWVTEPAGTTVRVVRNGPEMHWLEA